MEYRQTWRLKATPSGRLYWDHTASAHRTNDKGSGSCLTHYPTPRAGDGEKRGDVANDARNGLANVHLLPWHTPDLAPDAPNKGTNCKNVDCGLGNQVLPSGNRSISSPAETERSGVLNPEFVAWLMGYPEEWDDSGVTAMLSFRRLQRRSSSRILK